MGYQIPQNWWTLFDDPQLWGVIEVALANNPSLQAAHARIYSAQYNADKARSVLYPTLTFAGDVLREKLSKTGLAGVAGGQTSGVTPVGQPPGMFPAPPGTIPFYFTQYETSINVLFDFDIWQKNRNRWRAALGEMRAQMADEAFRRLALSIAVAEVYFRLQVNFKRLEIARNQVDVLTKYADLVQKRVNSNLENDLTLRTAQRNMSLAKQSALQIEGDIAISVDQLKAYTALNFEDQFYETAIAEQPLPKIPFPDALPLHLIAHRPDIVAQLWLIYSAGKRIEVAEAGFYPDVNLTGLIGFQTLFFPKWFEARSAYGDVDPAFTLPIFDGGLLLANLRDSEVDYDLAIFEYNQLVLNAARDVLDGLVVLTNTRQQLEQFSDVVGEQTDISELTKQRVKYHLDSELNYLQSEQQLYIARDQEMAAIGSTLQAALALIKALGGGYDACNQ